MTERSTQRRWSAGRLAVASALTATMAFGAVACGDDGGSGDESSAAPADPAVQRGEQISRSQGCAGCHGQDFGGGAGPSWIGLAGSEVLLADGSTVLADDAYLTRSIADPNAEITADASLQMPANQLSDAEIADVVAFINTLSGGDTTDG